MTSQPSKRPCLSDSADSAELNLDNSVTELVDTSTKVSMDSFLSPSHSVELSAEVRQALREELRAVLFDPVIIELQSKAVAAVLQEHIKNLQIQMTVRDKEIEELKKKNDDLEQYTRQNSIRITGVPESTNENTDDIIIDISTAIGASLKKEMIDRSHRVGPKSQDSRPRAIIVKLVSFRAKQALTMNRKQLAKIGGAQIFPKLTWPKPPSGWDGQRGNRQYQHRIFINEDLTKIRSEAAAKARGLKRDEKLKEVWIRGGSVCVRDLSDGVHVCNRLRDLERFDK